MAQPQLGRGRDTVAVIGAGIVGVSAALWLQRAGARVVLIDRDAPGQGASFGNAGLLAACAMVPVTEPGILRKAPGMALRRDSPLFLRWWYLPRMLPWLARYLRHATDAETRRIAAALAPLVTDSVDQHTALASGTGAERWLVESEYSFAYGDRAAFDADAYGWALRAEHGFAPVLREGDAVRAHEPALASDVGLLASVPGHGYVRDPGGYVADLAAAFEAEGGTIRRATVRDFELRGGRVAAVLTDARRIECEACVLATGAFSRPLMDKLGIRVPLESERGYHIVFRGGQGGPRAPVMVAEGKFVVTPMADGVRCAGLVEFGGTTAGPSRAPLDFLRRRAAAAFPQLRGGEVIEWMGHRPALSDSLPAIGEAGATGVFAAFGHHHVGLTGGPKTGRLVADLITGARPNLDLAPYDPNRFAR